MTSTYKTKKVGTNLSDLKILRSGYIFILYYSLQNKKLRNMTKVEKSIIIRKPVSEVFEYASDWEKMGRMV
jgi:hypothetical protein